MDQNTRNTLRNVVTQCRRLLEESVAQVLQGQFGIFAVGKKDEVQIEPEARMSHLSEEDRAYRQDLLDHFEHIKALGYKAKDALAQLIREVAFTHLNRFCAYRMMESRGLIRESVSKGLKSQGFLFYLADHEEDERCYNTGQQDLAYRHFLNWLGGTLSEEIGVLFAPTDPANRLYPPQRVIDEVLGLLNDPELAGIWSEDEAIGWVYQYFTPKELRDQARKESQAPRNSYELAFRNQFFTPRYVVEFLTDNTLGRIWYEMRRGDTGLKDQCRYMVRRPTEVFLKEGEQEPAGAAMATEDLSQEELLKLTVFIPFRAKKDPRDLRILDPACGSGHFLLYCFDLLLTIYEEAYGDPDLGPALKKDYPSLDDLRRDVPRLILAHNLHGIDIDLRASQIAALALWLRCQRAYQETGIKQDRPKITRSNIVCAEPMPGEDSMLKEFVAQLEPKILGHVVEKVFDKMKLAGEAGSLLKIEEEIRDTVASAKKQYAQETTIATDRKGRPLLFSEAEMSRLSTVPKQDTLFDVSDVTDAVFFEHAERRVVEALRLYAERAHSGRQLSRSLFSEDAVRGFAFVDICQKPYDVVLMNPPFGASPTAAKQYIDTTYPNGTNDLYATFVLSGMARVRASQGLVGAITSRAFLAGRHMRRFREALLPSRTDSHAERLAFLVDLGANILDEAVVEAACYIVASARTRPVAFADLRQVNRQLLGTKIPVLPNEYAWLLPEFFDGIPMRQFLYLLTESQVRSLNSGDKFEPHLGRVTKGLSTCSDERFVRCFWEVPPTLLYQRWFPLAKGGDYSWLTGTLHLVVDYEDNGRRLVEFNASIGGNVARSRQSSRHYFQPAATWSRRSNKGFSARRLRANCIFGDKSPVILPRERADLGWIAPLLMSSLYHELIEEQAKFGSYETACVKSLPLPENDLRSNSSSWHAVYAAIDQAERGDDTSWLFESVRYSIDPPQNLLRKALGLTEDLLAEHGYTISEEAKALALGDINDTEWNWAKVMLSCCVGYTFGRWNVQRKENCSTETDPFAALPPLPPGALLETATTPATTTPPGYPINIDWDGVLVDDSLHPDDIVARCRAVIHAVWGDEADAIEAKALGVLGVSTLHDYFRRSGKAGFWDDHISRYTKSRRKAPIYWLLQSSKRNYAIWLYYHRLDKDILFKALVNYVEPKIRLEADRLESLRSQKASGGAGKGAKKLDKDIEKQEDFLSELRDFEEKLRRAADLHLVPDLNDGVVLNIAPLHELVPWKEAEKYWEELLEGKYEWSSIGKQLREKGLVK
jgi:hypothetical protein